MLPYLPAHLPARGKNAGDNAHPVFGVWLLVNEPPLFVAVALLACKVGLPRTVTGILQALTTSTSGRGCPGPGRATAAEGNHNGITSWLLPQTHVTHHLGWAAECGWGTTGGMREWGQKMKSPTATKPEQLGLRATGVGSNQHPQVKKHRYNI